MTDARTTVLFLNRLGDPVIEYVERGLADPGIRVVRPPDAGRASLMALIPEADIVIGWGSDMDMLAAAEKLKLFINPGTGISQHIENFRKLCATRPVVLANGHGNSYAVAQHTVALTLALANKVIPYHQRMVEGRRRAAGPGTLYFHGITIGFLGYGAINQKVHRFLSGFDVAFAACRSGWDDDPGPFPTELLQYTPDNRSAFFEASDVVICALPTTRITKGSVTIDELRRLGENGLLVNVGRASAVVQEDIYKALKEKIIAGAALEVWWGRKKPREDAGDGRDDPYQFPFHELDNIVMSPHRGADSGGDLRRWDEVVENIRRLHQGRDDFLNVVDLAREY